MGSIKRNVARDINDAQVARFALGKPLKRFKFQLGGAITHDSRLLRAGKSWVINATPLKA